MRKPNIQASNEQAKPTPAETPSENAQQPSQDQTSEQVNVPLEEPKAEVSEISEAAADANAPSAQDLDAVATDPSLAPGVEISTVASSKPSAIEQVYGPQKRTLTGKKSAWFVKSVIQKDGHVYDPGSAIMLDEVQIPQLLDAGVIEPLKKEE